MTIPSSKKPSEVSADELAIRAIKQCRPEIQPGTAEHTAILEGLQAMCQHLGARKFELYYNLRPPSSRTEEWMRDCYQGRITEDELHDRLKRDAERPIDLEMLTAFHEAVEANLRHYSDILQKAVIRPSEDSRALRARRTREIDAHVSCLKAKLPLWVEQLETIYDFLDDVRLTSNLGLAKLGEFEGTSAHWLAELVLKRMTEAWRSCKAIARRSRRDPRYLYAANAIDLFREQWHSQFPSPQNLSERLRQEYRLARRAVPASASGPESSHHSCPPPDSTQSSTAPADNQSREMILIGEITSLVGHAGHIFRRFDSFDWGLDGEIEFKDAGGQATGKRVYVQLKSGDSHLSRRKSDGEEIFRVPKRRHLQYWAQHQYPVLLVIRQSSGLIRWMDIGAYVRRHGSENQNVVFRGSVLTVDAISHLASLPQTQAESTSEHSAL